MQDIPQSQLPPSEDPELTPPQQPISVHNNEAARWPMVLAAVGVAFLVVVMIGGLLLLSQSTPTSQNDQTPQEQDTSSSVSKVFQRMTVQDAEERKALCNDGTPAVYFFSQGSEAHAQDWIIHLHGGGYCSDSASCAARAQESPKYTSSKDYKETLRGEGIFSRSETDNPDFAEWNYVEVMYCSSDLWTGTADGLVEDEMWHFYGHYIVQAVIEDLQKPEIIPGSTLADASRVIFMGSSAGGVGAALNLDRVAGMLPDAKVTGLLDGALTMPVEPYDAAEALGSILSTDPVDYQGRLHDESCLAATNDLAVCTSVAGMYPYLETPVYVFTYQRDPVIIPNTTGIDNPPTADQQVYLNEVYLPAYMDVVAGIDPVFSSDQTRHTAAMSDLFFDTKINGVSFAEAFGDWYFDRSETSRYVE